jgi:uncharacterized membrane protein
LNRFIDAFVPPLAESEILAGEFFWGAPQWILPVVIVGVVLAAMVIWNYSQRGIPSPIRLLAVFLKLAAIAFIAVCLLEPMRSGTRPKPQSNVMPILVDNSQSMHLKSVHSEMSRGQKVAQLMNEEADWRVRLSQAFDTRTYLFDARLESVDSVTQMSMNGNVSSMKTSLRALSDRFADRPVAGVVLFSDGNLTDAPDADFDWSSLGFPVYPVLPSENDEVRDLRIADISTSQTDFESAPLTVRVTIDDVAMDAKDAFVQLIDLATGKLVEEKKLTLGAIDEPQEVKFRFRPDADASYVCAQHYANSGRPQNGQCKICKADLVKNNSRFYRVTTFTESDRENMLKTVNRQSDATKATDGQGEGIETPYQQGNLETTEATLANNERLVAVDRSSGPYRILYVAGRPNWEFKFLRRALQEDAEVELVGLLRIANKEPKFSFRDRGVSSTNPLFQGLGGDAEEAAQQYDQPVIIRLGVKDSDEISDGFPDTTEELFAYHGVILDDVETEFFTQDQMLMLRRFVSARGGGLLMLGGQESFANKEFGDSPLGELSPVYATSQSVSAKPGSFRLALTREGMLQPWVRLRDTESGEKDRLSKMPSFTSLNTVGEIKPGASQLATVRTDDGREAPALIAQRFGKGRTAAVPMGDLWRWSMRRDDRGRDDPAQWWRQVTHWLVNEVPRRTDVQIEQSKDPSQPVSIVASARDEDYLPLDNANVELTIMPIDGEPFTIKAESDDSVPGQYKATYWTRDPDGYRVTANVVSADGKSIGQSTSAWAAQSSAAEFDNLQLNRKLLTHIAKQTHGEVIRDDALDAFVADLPNRRVPVTETWVYPVWHRASIMMLAMACLCFEWGLRRFKGLA